MDKTHSGFYCNIYNLKHSEKIAFFQTTLLEWFHINGRSFQWRKSSISNYEIIISEILLQRTKAETVSKFYDDFLIKFPNWRSLASAELADIEKFLIPIGLYRQRAGRLHGLAKCMVSQNGELPNTRKELEQIPFMGQYIANAVELLINKTNKPLLDVNMARVLERYFKPRKLADIRYDPYLQKLAHDIVKHQNAKEINWGVLDFAAAICQARVPKCAICPMTDNCTYYKKSQLTIVK